jgi:Xaa-Pro aminopeptidase
MKAQNVNEPGPVPDQTCLERKHGLSLRWQALNQRNLALGERVTAMRASCAEAQAAHTPDSQCHARYTTFVEDINQWQANNPTAWFDLDTAISAAMDAIDCTKSQEEIDAAIQAAELGMKQMDAYLDSKDQEVGTFEAALSALYQDCPPPAIDDDGEDIPDEPAAA